MEEAKSYNFEKEFNIFASKEKPMSQTLGMMSMLKEGCNDAAKEMALKYFRMGVLINAKKTELTFHELSHASGVSKHDLTRAKHIAEKYKNNELDFLKAFQHYPREQKTWNTFYTWAIGDNVIRKRTKQRTNKTLINAISETNKILKHYREDPSVFPQLVEDAKYIRGALARYIPETVGIIDKEHLKYNECCCCGAYPPPEEGYRLRSDTGTEYLKYPICDHCDVSQAEPDYKRIAELYGRYASNIESSFDKLRELE